jgi:hypothetical protein
MKGNICSEKRPPGFTTCRSRKGQSRSSRRHACELENVEPPSAGRFTSPTAHASSQRSRHPPPCFRFDPLLTPVERSSTTVGRCRQRATSRTMAALPPENRTARNRQENRHPIFSNGSVIAEQSVPLNHDQLTALTITVPLLLSIVTRTTVKTSYSRPVDC